MNGAHTTGPPTTRPPPLNKNAFMIYDLKLILIMASVCMEKQHQNRARVSRSDI